ncbi:L shaped tail fiber protein [Bacillus phage vB_BcgM]|nr:L shaped tail fiber protein [Bacillus phage vB_BcgM]
MDINEIVITGAIGLTLLFSACYSCYIIGFNKGVSATQKAVSRLLEDEIKEIDTKNNEISFK